MVGVCQFKPKLFQQKILNNYLSAIKPTLQLRDPQTDVLPSKPLYWALEPIVAEENFKNIRERFDCCYYKHFIKKLL